MDRAVTYLTNNHQHMKYDKALAKGWDELRSVKRIIRIGFTAAASQHASEAGARAARLRARIRCGAA
jgi:hypothetical protein